VHSIIKIMLPLIQCLNSETNMKATRTLQFVFVISVVLLMTGCATPIQPAEMTPASFEIQNKHDASVQLKVEGGQETNPVGFEQISGTNFQQAIADAIRNSGVFSHFKESGADYKLSVGIISVNQPAFGLNVFVSMAAQWKLTRIATGEVVLQEVIIKSSTAGMDKGILGTTRCRKATQGAAQENIKEGIFRLSQLKF